MKLAIVGFGLIGSSLARAAKRVFGNEAEIIAVDSNADALTCAVDLHLCDHALSNLSDLPQDCDWIILAAPVTVNLRLLGDIMPRVGPNTRLSDVGSTKTALVDALNQTYPDFDRFIPAHPMAGREVSGPEHGRVDLFDDKLVILTPPLAATEPHIKAAEDFYTQMGARTQRMNDATEHDRLMGYASHLPHLLAFAFVNLAAEGNNGQTDYQDLTGGGYRDFTRIAASDPLMWRDIFFDNKDNILAQLDGFSAILERYRKSISSGDSEAVIKLMHSARDERQRLQQIIKGQTS